MKQLLTIVHHELLDYWRDGRFRALSLTMLMLLLAVGAWGWHSYRTSESERLAFQGQVWEQWINQGAKHPHRAAHFGQYVIKPELPLAGFDPGVKPTVGQTLWVEAHTRSAYSYAPMDDSPAMQTRFGITGVAGVVQILITLLVLVMAAPSIARERESGTLRQMLALGIPPARWLAGKYAGACTALLLVLLPVGLLITAVLGVSHTDAGNGPIMARTMLMMAAYLLYLFIVMAIGFAISAVSDTTKTAMISVLILWVLWCICMPRLSGHLAAYIQPVPEYQVFRDRINHDFMEGYDEEPGWDERLAALEHSVKAKYHVERLEDLPVGFSGIRMQVMDDWSQQVTDRIWADLTDRYRKHYYLRSITGLINPLQPLREFSQAMAGMDWDHYQHFADVTEAYRRGVVARMDKVLEDSVIGDAWEMNAGRKTWESVGRLSYTMPGPGWALGNIWLSVALLIGWAALAGVGLLAAARRLKP